VRTVPSGHLRSGACSCTIKRMACEECGASAEGEARRWEAHLAAADEVDDVEPVLVYCPRCAAQGF
jgi:hypothetical protein